MRTGAVAITVAAALLAACGGGGSSSTQSNGTCTPGTTATVTITSSGVSPKSSCVLPGGNVTFANHDTGAHTIQPTTAGAGCAGLDIGSIAGNGSATSGTLPTAMACGYSDGTTNAAFAGTVFVQSAPAGGPGH
jgi:plastocyanin